MRKNLEAIAQFIINLQRRLFEKIRSWFLLIINRAYLKSEFVECVFEKIIQTAFFKTENIREGSLSLQNKFEQRNVPRFCELKVKTLEIYRESSLESRFDYFEHILMIDRLVLNNGKHWND